MTLSFVKTEPGADPIIVEGFFAATPHAVFRAWTDPAVIVKWFGPQPGSLLSADVDLRIGGAWRFVMSDDERGTTGFEGEYLDIRPHSRLVLSWSKFSTRTGSTEVSSRSRVEIALSDRGKGTHICITHSAIQDDEMRIGFAGGWEHGMENLRDQLAAQGVLFSP